MQSCGEWKSKRGLWKCILSPETTCRYKKEGKREKTTIISFTNEINFIIFTDEIEKETIMSEKEMKSYRFGMGQEPTDEILEQVMKEVAQEARESSKKAADAHFEQMRRNIAQNRASRSARINSIING